ncbi:DUF1905 domain-containing protein [Novosphingobium humi]|uniref:DUF1905 domain-containing protein n=1 Tax=Novosphingobium humi TaxID=2282397 RepID=A0ABY7U437_9SPHN|nr:DUF1905 domain-containing protein [Novosphingobium humi]WCT79375.1 DUF1905 domain-containing protein [Novosphingobium humi]
MSERGEVTFTGTVWVWQAHRGGKPTRWFFVSITGAPAAELKLASLGLTAGFGSLAVRATIGTTTWHTSIFPQRETGGWILPLKAELRKREKIGEGSRIEVSLVV